MYPQQRQMSIDKQELVNKIQQEATLWESFLADVGEDRMEEPGAWGDWTIKDAVAHLSAWRQRTLAQLEAARRDQTPSSSFWPAGWEEENEEDLKKINRWIYEENRERPLTEVLNESRQQYRYMQELVKSLPEVDLNDAQRFDWMEGKPLASLIDFGHFHEEHEPILRQWVA